jgi:hypothetical protein
LRRAAVAWSALGALGGALACGVITLPPVPMAPTNTCADNAACDKSFPDAGVSPQCSGGACVGSTAFRPVLVVSVPEGARSPIIGIGGSTFGLPEAYEAAHVPFVPSKCQSVSVECDFLPPLASVVNGNLLVSKGFGIALWPPGGLRPNQSDPTPPTPPSPTSLPIHVAFHPMWVDPASGSPVLASKLGLPLGDVSATIARSSFLLGPTASPDPVPGYTFSALLPQPLDPADPSGSYLVEIVPDDPFDVFPPYLRQISVAPGQAGLAQAQLDLQLTKFDPTYTVPPLNPPIVQHDYEIDELTGAPDMSGWTVQVVDADGHRISGIVTLPAGPTKTISVFDATGATGQSGQTLFVDPPPGTDYPRLVAATLGTSNIPYGPWPYPALPDEVTVSGFVLRADDQTTRASAHVIFYADGQVPTVFQADGTPPVSPLLYEKEVKTTDQGQYAATLRPGTLRAYVIPDADDLALTVDDGQLVSPGNPVQPGRALFVNPRSHVRGRVVLPDGTPVYAADVVIDASADDPFPPNVVDPLARPREARGRTDADGRFDVLSDPGLVDISIRPQDGTRLPWVVLTSRTVLPSIPGDGGPPGGLTLAKEVVVPLPTPFTQAASSGVVTDAVGNALPNAVVRAYAFPPPAQVDGGTPPTRGARLIGATVSDSSGVFRLFLAPPD